MNGVLALVQRIAFRSASLVLLSLACATTFSCAIGQSNSGSIKSFHDEALNITYFYPAEFVPVPSGSTADDPSRCIKSTLFVSSVERSGSSSFALSTIGNTCPDTLRAASELGPFTRAQVLNELKQYGEPHITQEPFRYAIAGHPAAITVASVATSAASGKVAQLVYTAKACALGNALAKTRKKSDAVEPVTHIVCFDFTTQNSEKLTEMFSFIIQFDNAPVEPIFPGSVIRNTGVPTLR
jgi:hypothetical protein